MLLFSALRADKQTRSGGPERAAASKHHFSPPPLSSVTFPPAKQAAVELVLFYSLIVFPPGDYCRAICTEPRTVGEPARTSLRHLVLFVGLDLFAVSVIDFCLGGEENK